MIPYFITVYTHQLCCKKTNKIIQLQYVTNASEVHPGNVRFQIFPLQLAILHIISAQTWDDQQLTHMIICCPLISAESGTPPVGTFVMT